MSTDDLHTAGVAFSLVPLYKAIPPEPRRLLVLVRARSDVDLPEDRPTHLTVALDASGSMDGVKMGAAVATLHALVDELGPSDAFGLVTFSTDARVAFPASQMTASAKQIAHACLDRVRPDGGTDLAGAALTALRVSESASAERRHVIVLTDGYPTAGVRDDAQIATLLQGARGAATVSVFGYGEDVRPELLERLADVGGGRYHFVLGTEPPVEAFAAELGHQRALLAVDVTLELLAGDGATIGYLPSLAHVQRREPEKVRLSMSSLLAGDTRSVVVGIALGPEAFALDARAPWLRAQLRYRSVLDGDEHELEAQLVPVIAAAKSPPAREVAREFAIQRLAELVHAVAHDVGSELEQEKVALVEFITRMGLATEPQVLSGIALLSRLMREVRDESKRKAAGGVARAAAKGMYDREVTGLGMGAAYAKGRTQVTLARMSKSMLAKGDGDPGGKPGGGGDLN